MQESRSLRSPPDNLFVLLFQVRQRWGAFVDYVERFNRSQYSALIGDDVAYRIVSYRYDQRIRN